MQKDRNTVKNRIRERKRELTSPGMVQITINGRERRVGEISIAMNDQETLQPSKKTQTDG